MSNWGAALGGFATGFQTGYSTTSSAIDRYERRQAEKELREATEAAMRKHRQALGEETGINFDDSRISGIFSKDTPAPVEDRSTVLNSDGSRGPEATGKSSEAPASAIDLSKLGNEGSSNRDKYNKVKAFQDLTTTNASAAPTQQAAKSSSKRTKQANATPLPTQQASAIGNTGGINFNDSRLPRYFNQDTPAPVEDLSTPIQPKTAESPKRSRAITPPQSKAPTRANIAKHRQAKTASQSTLAHQSSGNAYAPPPLKAKELRLTGTHERFANEEAIARERARRPDPMASTIARTSPEAQPASADLKRYGAEAASRTKATPTMWDELSGGAAPGDNIRDPSAIRRMKLGGTTPLGGTESRFAPEEDIAARRRAFAMTPEEAQARVASGQMEDVYARQQAEAMTPEESQARAAASQMESVYGGQPSALHGGVAPDPQQSSQPSALNGGASGPRQYITTNDVLTPEQRRFEADRQLNAELRQAEIRFLLKTDPYKGLQVAKQYAVENAKEEFSENVRRAMSGDPESLSFFAKYAGMLYGEPIEISPDGKSFMRTDVNGRKVPEQITPQMIQQVAMSAYPMHMWMNGMAVEKAFDMMGKLGEMKLTDARTKSANANAYKAMQDAARMQGLRPGDTQEIVLDDGTVAYYDQANGLWFDQKTGYWLKHSPQELAGIAEQYPDAKIIPQRNGSVLVRLASGEVVNPNSSNTTPEQAPSTLKGGALAQKPVAMSISDSGVGLLKELEGFQASPYSDYSQTSIGYGTRAQEGDANITKEEAARRLQEHIDAEITPALNEAAATNNLVLTQNQFDALSSLCYNIGTQTFLKSKAFKALVNGDMELFRTEVADPERGFTKVRGPDGKLVVSPALVERRRREMELFFQ